MIDAIFIQSHYGEILNGRLFRFLSQDFFKMCDIPVILFLDEESAINSQGAIEAFYQSGSLNSKRFTTISVFDKKIKNKTTHVLQFLMNYEVANFRKILLLETDCIVKDSCLQVLNEDLKRHESHDWFIYGSYYYGSMSIVEKLHMNGVAVYNRSELFINTLNTAINYRNGLFRSLNYDILLHLEISKRFDLSKYIDSKYIINISPECDKGLDYQSIKPESVIIHQKI
jgi:hypothetical protein